MDQNRKNPDQLLEIIRQEENKKEENLKYFLAMQLALVKLMRC